MADNSNQLGVVRNWQPPYPLAGHCFLFGRVGSGKTQKGLRIAQAYHSMGYKILDIFGGRRNEGAYWALPSDEKTLWNQFEDETFEFNKPGAKEYKVNLLFPMFSKKMPKDLPNLPDGRVKSKVFTIPFKEIEESDIATVFFPMSSTAKILWQKIQEELPDKANGADIESFIEYKHPKRKKDALYNLFIKPLIDNHTLSSKNGDLNLDFVTECEDKETISVLCLDFVPERYKIFIMKYFTKMIKNLATEDKIHKRNILFFREMSLFMKVVDSDKSRDETTQVFRNHFVDMARYGRSGYFIVGDSQDSSEVKGAIQGSEDILCVCEMPDPASREFTCQPLKRDRRMNEAQMRYIATMPIHQIAVVERGKKMKILKRIQPPRTRGWKAQDGNFFSVWRKEKDSWTHSQNFIDMIEKEYESRDDAILVMKSKTMKRSEKAESESDEDKDGMDDEEEKVDTPKMEYESTKESETEEDNDKKDEEEQKRKLKKQQDAEDDGSEDLVLEEKEVEVPKEVKEEVEDDLFSMDI